MWSVVPSQHTSLASTGDAATTAPTSVDQIWPRRPTLSAPSVTSRGLCDVRSRSKPYVAQSVLSASVVEVVVVVDVVLGGWSHLVRSPSSRQAPRMDVRHARWQGRRNLLRQALAGRPEGEAHALRLQSATALRQGPIHAVIALAQSLAQGFLPGNACVAATTRAIEASDRRTIRTRACTSQLFSQLYGYLVNPDGRSSNTPRWPVVARVASPL